MSVAETQWSLTSNLLFVLIFGAFHRVGGLISLCKNCVFNQNGFLDFSPRCAGTAGMDHPEAAEMIYEALKRNRSKQQRPGN